MIHHSIETLFTASIIKMVGKVLDNGIKNLQLEHMLWI
jgi:hypothetical protein